MAKAVVVGIDVGTSYVKIVVAERERGSYGAPKILGTGSAESKGLRHGYIINSGDVTRSIRAALSQAEKTSGVSIKHCYLAIGGVSLDELFGRGETMISRADSEITELDIDKALAASEANLPKAALQNRRIVHTIPLSYRIDGEEALGPSIIGMKGMKLEIRTLFVTCLEQHLNDLVHAVEAAGVEVDDVMASPIAASFVALTKAQKKAGCVLANIGAETVSIVVFENNTPLSIKVFPIGSTDVTNDIALGLRVPLEEAEQIKLGAITNADYPKKKLEDIIAARLSDLFELIEAHLKKIGRNGLLPAGIILAGGGSEISSAGDLAKAILKLPCRTASIRLIEGRRELADGAWTVAYGLCLWGLSTDESEGSGIRIAKATSGSILSFLKQFLP